jgi:hypothetical protein
MEDNMSVFPLGLPTSGEAISVDDEITAMRNKLQERQMRLVADSYGDGDDNGPIDLDNEDVFERSGLEDAKLIQRMQDARLQYRQHLEEMDKIPDVMHLRSNYVDHISNISNEITTLNDFYNENHEAMNMPHRVFKKLIEVIALVRSRKFDSVETDIEACIKLLKTSQSTCDATMRQIKKTQDNLFVLRRNIDKNCDDMLRSVAAHKEQVSKMAATRM